MMISGSFNALNKGATYAQYTVSSPADGYGTPRSYRAGTVSSGAAFTFASIPISTTGSFETLYFDVHLTTRANWNGTVRVKYIGRIAVHTKDNTVPDAWVVTLDNVLYTAGEWTTAPAVSISNPTSTTGLLTITGDPIDADGSGVMRLVQVR
jgi:hypothetical protein